ncbi:MAG: hypothetical protein ABR990_06420 [Terracidiphilus sp.]|jgi:hypothetical protein
MKKIISMIAAMLTALLMLPANGSSQTPQKANTFRISGHAGEAQILQINGKSYVEIEILARLTQGTLSFKANQTTLTLPPLDAEAQASPPHAKAGFSTAFVQAGIEEMSLIREWRIAIVNAVQNNNPVSEDWVSAHHRLADKNLALASAAASTDDDRSAFPLLTAEFNNMQKLSDLYLAMRKQDTFISPDEFNNNSLEEQIMSCARSFVSMTESHEFHDQASCH